MTDRPWDHLFLKHAEAARLCGTDVNDELEKEWGASRSWYENYLQPWLSEGGGAVCEIGPGTGRMTQYVMPLSCRYYLCDYSDTALDILKSVYGADSRAIFVKALNCKIPDVPDRSCTFAFGIGVFVHLFIEQVHSYLCEFARILSPGGHCVVHFADFRYDFDWFRNHLPTNLDEGRSIFRYHHPEHVAFLAESVGIKTIAALEIEQSRHRFFVGVRDAETAND